MEKRFSIIYRCIVIEVREGENLEKSQELKRKRAMNTKLVRNMNRGTNSAHVLMTTYRHSRRIIDELFTVGDRKYLLFLMKYLYTYRNFK